MLHNFNNCLKNRQGFIKQNLPDPTKYYQDQGVNLIGVNEWKSALCPFHDDKRPSLRINTKSGGYICMSCHEKGGDVIAFHRKRFDLNFKEACIALGSWGER
jgi:DNA primase